MVWLAFSHKAYKWQSQDLNWDSLNLETVSLITMFPLFIVIHVENATILEWPVQKPSPHLHQPPFWLNHTGKQVPCMRRSQRTHALAPREWQKTLGTRNTVLELVLTARPRLQLEVCPALPWQMPLLSPPWASGLIELSALIVLTGLHLYFPH